MVSMKLARPAAAKPAAQESKPKTVEDRKAKATTKSIEESHVERLEVADERVKRSTVETAVAALCKHVKLHRAKVKEAKAKLNLFEETDAGEEAGNADASLLNSKSYVHVSVGLMRPSIKHKKSFKTFRVPLTRPFHHYEQADLDMCLFVKDAEEAEKWLANKPVRGLKKVISLKDLRSKYHQYQQRRELAAMYDVFLADDRIVNMLPNTLGRVFFGTNKAPIKIRLAQCDKITGSLESRVKQALECAYFRYSGACSTMRSAIVTWPEEDIVANVMDCIAEVGARLPGSWRNIQSIHIKTGNSAALPVFVQNPTPRILKEGAEVADHSSKGRKRSRSDKKGPAKQANASSKKVKRAKTAPTKAEGVEDKAATKSAPAAVAEKAPKVAAAKTVEKKPSKTPSKAPKASKAPAGEDKAPKTPAKTPSKAVKAKSTAKPSPKSRKAPASSKK